MNQTSLINLRTTGALNRVSLLSVENEIEDGPGNLFNCPEFEVAFKRRYRKACEANTPLCIAICDIDRFNLISNTHSPEVGVRVVAAVARLMQRTLGNDCLLTCEGRKIVLLLGTQHHQTIEIIDDILEAFSQRKLIDRRTELPIGRVSFSGGVTNVFGYADLRDALASAEEALHQAKKQGGRCILMAEKLKSPIRKLLSNTSML